MALYFFDFEDGDRRVRDDEGTELDTWEMARQEAISMLPEIARDELPDGEHRRFVATVRDEGGHDLYRATLTFEGAWLR